MFSRNMFYRSGQGEKTPGRTDESSYDTNCVCLHMSASIEQSYFSGFATSIYAVVKKSHAVFQINGNKCLVSRGSS